MPASRSFCNRCKCNGDTFHLNDWRLATFEEERTGLLLPPPAVSGRPISPPPACFRPSFPPGKISNVNLARTREISRSSELEVSNRSSKIKREKSNSFFGEGRGGWKKSTWSAFRFVRKLCKVCWFVYFELIEFYHWIKNYRNRIKCWIKACSMEWFNPNLVLTIIIIYALIWPRLKTCILIIRNFCMKRNCWKRKGIFS